MSKDFENFVATLTPGKNSELLQRALSSAQEVAASFEPGTGGQKAETAAMAYWIALDLLKEYHEWLNQEP